MAVPCPFRHGNPRHRRRGMTLTILNVAYPFAPVGPDTAGGAEQVLWMLDRALCRAGHTSVVVACQGSSVEGTLVDIPPTIWRSRRSDDPARSASTPEGHRGHPRPLSGGPRPYARHRLPRLSAAARRAGAGDASPARLLVSAGGAATIAGRTPGSTASPPPSTRRRSPTRTCWRRSRTASISRRSRGLTPGGASP